LLGATRRGERNPHPIQPIRSISDRGNDERSITDGGYGIGRSISKTTIAVWLREMIADIPKEAEEEARANLKKVGLIDKAGQYPSRLSGGQQQRVAIARALAMEPAIMLFDEVTSSLDPELVGEVLRVMRDLADEGMTMLVVTHELGFAYHVAKKVLFLHEGVIHEQGTPDEVLKNPHQERTKAFLTGFTDFYF